MLTYADLDIPLEAFGIDANTFAVELFYTLTSTYERPNGKFSLIFSNAALVDCHYIFPSFIFSLEKNLEKIKVTKPEIYQKAKEVLDQISDWLTVNDVTFCDFGYDLNGVLKDQSSYYLDSYADILQGLEWKAEEISDALTLKTNYTISEPLATQFGITSQI